MDFPLEGSLDRVNGDELPGQLDDPAKGPGHYGWLDARGMKGGKALQHAAQEALSNIILWMPGLGGRNAHSPNVLRLGPESLAQIVPKGLEDDLLVHHVEDDDHLGLQVEESFELFHE